MFELEKRIIIGKDEYEIFKFLDRVGIASRNDIIKMYEVKNIKKSYERVRVRLYELIKYKFLERVSYHDEFLVCNAINTGIRFINKKINYANLHHTLMVNKVYLFLLANYLDVTIRMDHEIRADMSLLQNVGVGIKGKIPDLTIENSEGEIWVEIELNLKSKNAMKKILDYYFQKMLCKEIIEVIYFTNNNEVINFFKRYFKEYPNIKISLFVYNSEQDSWLKIANKGQFLI